MGRRKSIEDSIKELRLMLKESKEERENRGKETAPKFEIYVKRLFEDIGKKNVRHNIRYKVVKDGKPIYCQIDLTYGRLNRRYVECKYREHDTVSLEHMTKFVGKLQLLGINPRRGVMVTNTRFRYVAEVDAKKYGVEMITNKELLEMERRRRGFLERMFYKERPLEQIIKKTKV